MAHFNFTAAPNHICVVLGLSDTTAFKAWFPSMNEAAHTLDPFYGNFPPGYIQFLDADSSEAYYVSGYCALEVTAILVRVETEADDWSWCAAVDCALWRLSLTRPEEF